MLQFFSGKSCVTRRVTRLLFSFFGMKTVQKRTWIGGHKSSVLSLDVSREGILASGGEEELYVWSKDGAPQTKLSCSSAESKEVNSVCFCGKNPERLYASCGNKIFGYDLRNLSSTVCEFEFNEEEINQVTIHDRGTYLAACDDSGEVKVVDIQSGRLFKTLKRKHENICSTAQFRPSRPWEIVSGGMDFKVISWDFSSGRSLQELNVQELGEDSQEGAYFVNPPFVHSIHMAGNGRKFASGLGNGNIQLFRFEGKKKFTQDECLKKHTSSVSQVHFPTFQGNDLLVSAGNDCRIILWKLNQDLCNGTSGAEHCQGSEAASSTWISHEVKHGSKTNWIASCSLTNNIFVSDQTSEISVYHVI